MLHCCSQQAPWPWSINRSHFQPSEEDSVKALPHFSILLLMRVQKKKGIKEEKDKAYRT